MAYQNQFLLRQSLSDNGSPQTHGSYCSSPDIISHSLVNDPVKTFTTNYNIDPNQRIDQDSMTNPVYTRIKSMQSVQGKVNGYIRLYRANFSLFLNTNQWSKNPLRTPKGSTHVTVSTGKKDEISVGNDIFTLDGTKPNYCLIGIVNDSTVETLPDNFKTHNDFVMWIHKNPAVSARNFSLMKSGNRNDFEGMYVITNPESISRLGAVNVHAENLPDGTLFGLENKDLMLNKSTKFFAKDDRTHKVSDASDWPANYDGYIRVFAKLPTGAVWPSKARFTVTYYTNAILSEEMHIFGHMPEDIICNPAVLSTFQAPGKLVLIGECSTLFE